MFSNGFAVFFSTGYTIASSEMTIDGALTNGEPVVAFHKLEGTILSASDAIKKGLS